MKNKISFLLLLICFSQFLLAQKKVGVISRCGGIDSVFIPSVIDNDKDGMDDNLEAKLLNHFMPTFIIFDDESCPGPALNGTGDSNLVVSHIYPIPQQYCRNNTIDSVKSNPTAIVPARGLTIGLVWYEPTIMINAAILYGKDCGALGHTADVEGFTFSLKYTGPDTSAGWMYDTLLSNWRGGTIQSISHAGTLCEQKETLPYKSSINPTGIDTVYVSPDKHGNYLSIAKCGSSFICNPGCGGIPSVKAVRNVNVGEQNFPLVTDLGSYYTAYAGESPWTSVNFLNAQGGNAGAIQDKMIKPLSTDFIIGNAISSSSQICNLYKNCFGSPTSTFVGETCKGIPYIFRGKSILTAGTYKDTITTNYGCDSVIALSLTVKNPVSVSLNRSICQGDSFYFKGKFLYQPTVLKDTLKAANNCDSIVTLSLNVGATILQNTTRSICEGDSFLFRNKFFKSSTFYNDTLKNSITCDSVYQLNLTVNPLPIVIWNTTTDTVLSTGVAILLTGATPLGGIYSGPGVSGNLFRPSLANKGDNIITYTFTSTDNCSSAASKKIVVISPTGVNETITTQSFHIYPNPVNEKLTVEVNGWNLENVIPIIFDALGRIQKTSFINESNQLIVSTNDLESGWYYLSLNIKGKLIIQQFYKATN